MLLSLNETKALAFASARTAFAGLQGIGNVVARLAIVAAAVLVMSGVAETQSFAQTRALKLLNLHTREKTTIVFKRDGRYDTAGLKKLNTFLRDWRKNEPTHMDPRLFDLIWEVYQKTGSNEYINVVCGYRSPGTNAMLRSRSKMVAEKSQHIQGKAMDFFIPGVKLARLREIGMKFQVGGVGFYPRSGSPFVHMDVGSVRSWPRMSRAELARLFPNGRTLHKPAEGGTMPGYNQAMADYKKRVGSNAILVAGGGSDNSDTDTGGKHKSLLAALFGGDEDEGAVAEADIKEIKNTPVVEIKDEASEPVLTAAAEPEPAIGINAPVPKVRPAFAEDQVPAVETALVSPQDNPAEEAMKAAMTPDAQDETFADLGQYKIPVPTMLGNRNQNGDADAQAVLTASADPTPIDTVDTVPVPDQRPEVANDEANVDSNQGVSDLSQDEVAALAAEASAGTPAVDTSTDEDEADDADIADSLDLPADDNNSMAEMASLETEQTTVTRSFELKPSSDDAADTTPVTSHAKKGGRINKVEALAAVNEPEPVVTEPKLTSNIIAKWALTNGRVATLSKSVKAPRFVSSTMREQPTTVYAEGFTQANSEVDPARFSGTSVNFIPVKKFTQTN